MGNVKHDLFNIIVQQYFLPYWFGRNRQNKLQHKLVEILQEQTV
ncbi:hypothetical protein pb186bvf_010536 [Paramecium bursaria]